MMACQSCRLGTCCFAAVLLAAQCSIEPSIAETGKALPCGTRAGRAPEQGLCNGTSRNRKLYKVRGAGFSLAAYMLPGMLQQCCHLARVPIAQGLIWPWGMSTHNRVPSGSSMQAVYCMCITNHCWHAAACLVTSPDWTFACRGLVSMVANGQTNHGSTPKCRHAATPWQCCAGGGASAWLWKQGACSWSSSTESRML